MTNHTNGGNHQFFSSAFFSALVEAMTEAGGSPWLIAAAPDSGQAAKGSEPVRIKLTLDGSLSGEFLLEFNRAEAAMLASKILRQPADEFGTEQSDALLKLIEAGAGKFRSALERDYGAFTILASLASEASFSSEAKSGLANIVRMTAADDDANRASILMYLNPALAQALLLHSQAESAAADPAESAKAAADEAIPDPVNLDLVMDVELNVTLRFGQRQLTLREVLDLTTGSVVELDRQVEEPVELLLDGLVIARGEAVVIDGNYGLRVTEVSQPVSYSVLH
jgi:flagellar motor switch protein FliN/FliY